MAGERDSIASFEGCRATPGTVGVRCSAPGARSHPAVRRWGLWPALVLALLAFVGVSALETFSLDPSRPVAVLFPAGLPGERAFAAVVAAGGLPIRPARSALSDGAVWIAAAGAADFFDKVRANGAWAVINPFAFGGCFLVKPV
jgi:hypothetical protein